MILCIILIISAAAFGSKNIVGVFGFNVFIVQSDNVSTAPKNSAVIVKKCSAYDLSVDNLAVYTKSEEGIPALGYVKDITKADGAYYVKVNENGEEHVVHEKELVGHAEYSSAALGAVISFIQTPLGVFCLAVLPCAALILFDVTRAAAAKMPLPEVVPQVKNDDLRAEGGAKTAVNSKIAVNSEGKATYSRNSDSKQNETANGVLFSYSGKQQPRGKPAEQRPIIPLTDKSSDIKLPERRSAGYTTSVNTNETANPVRNAGTIRFDEPKTPRTAAVGRYAQDAETDKHRPKPSGKTAELPDILGKKDNGDAFFTQTDAVAPHIRNGGTLNGEAPQIGRLLSDGGKAAADRPGRADAVPGRTAKTAGKRSTQILASKRVEDLIDDDDDERETRRRDSGGSAVNDILAGLERKK